MKTEHIKYNAEIEDGQKIRAFVCGHTGATGKALLDTLMTSPYCESVVAVGRRENDAHKGSPKLTQQIVPNMLEICSWDPKIAKECNAAFCCIGTSFYDVFKKSKAAEYRAVDFGIATEFAKFAYRAGVQFFAVITGEGSDSSSKSNMYRVKGEVEDCVKTIGFERVAFLRPGLLNRGADATLMERIASLGGTIGLPVSKIADGMAWMALAQTVSVGIYSSKEIREAASMLENASGMFVKKQSPTI